jgi:hypothetical protein
MSQDERRKLETKQTRCPPEEEPRKINIAAEGIANVARHGTSGFVGPGSLGLFARAHERACGPLRYDSTLHAGIIRFVKMPMFGCLFLMILGDP